MKEIIGRAMARNKEQNREYVLLGHLSKPVVKNEGEGKDG